MQQIFSQAIRFKKDDGTEYEDWEEKKLKDNCSFFSGGTPKSTRKDFYNGNIPFIGSANIFDEKVDKYITQEALESSSAKIVKKGDILYALYGANSGNVGVSKLSGAIKSSVLMAFKNASKAHW